MKIIVLNQHFACDIIFLSRSNGFKGGDVMIEKNDITKAKVASS
ncbi:MAG: hypothetical protein WA160_13850 [Pseudobdellovibrio sp.]